MTPQDPTRPRRSITLRPALSRHGRRALALLALVALPLAFATLTARADDDDDEAGHGHAPRVMASAMPPVVKQECSACHVAYPPQMLPQASWQRLMNNLPRHFGTDASLDARTTQQISAWLLSQAPAAGPRLAAPPQDRITRSDWFLRQHDDIGAAVWKRPAIKSPSNCVACHTRADQGDFNERFVRIPR